MILTRRFGALRARPEFPSMVEPDERLEYFGDFRLLEESLQENEKAKDSEESAA